MQTIDEKHASHVKPAEGIVTNNLRIPARQLAEKIVGGDVPWRGVEKP